MKILMLCALVLVASPVAVGQDRATRDDRMKAVTATLADGLKSKDAGERAAALYAVKGYENDDLVKVVASAMKDRDGQVKIAAFEVLGRMLGWKKRLHVRGAENVPTASPAIFYANHIKIDDPLCLYASICRARGRSIEMCVMMRDDFFNIPRVSAYGQRRGTVRQVWLVRLAERRRGPGGGTL